MRSLGSLASWPLKAQWGLFRPLPTCRRKADLCVNRFPLNSLSPSVSPCLSLSPPASFCFCLCLSPAASTPPAAHSPSPSRAQAVLLPHHSSALRPATIPQPTFSHERNFPSEAHECLRVCKPHAWHCHCCAHFADEETEAWAVEAPSQAPHWLVTALGLKPSFFRARACPLSASSPALPILDAASSC